MVPVLLGAGLVLALVAAIYLKRRPPRVGARASLLPAVRAIHAPLPWERAYWRRAPKDGGRRG
jgi:hypothetical protein